MAAGPVPRRSRSERVGENNNYNYNKNKNRDTVIDFIVCAVGLHLLITVAAVCDFTPAPRVHASDRGAKLRKVNRSRLLFKPPMSVSKGNVKQ